MTDCVYLDQDSIEFGRQPICYRYGKCRLTTPKDTEFPAAGIPSCDTCKEKLLISDPDLAGKFRDPLHIVDKHAKAVTCFEASMRHPGIAFLVCGGPSARQLPMSDLNRRGCWSLAVNNVAGWDAFRPQAFVHSDPPSKFHSGIWLDPGIMKFVPIPKFKKKRGGLRRKIRDKQFEQLTFPDGQKFSTCDCPNAWGFLRRSWMRSDDSFFTEHGATMGNLNVGVARTGEQKTICSMLLGLRILYHLGARTIFLVGVDFRMDSAKGLTDNYSFGENRDADACASNNAQFAVINELLCRTVKSGVFERFGLDVYNCNRQSGLRAFPHVPFSQAIGMATAGMETPFDLNGWYWKPPKKERERRKKVEKK